MPKLKFKASPTPEQADAIQTSTDRLRKFMSDRAAAQQRADVLDRRITALRNEESLVSDKIKTAAREGSRAIAIELAAIRIEIQEAERQQSENLAALESDPKVMRGLLADTGSAIAEACRAFSDEAKEEFVRTTAPFFSQRATAWQMANQTDLHRAVGYFMSTFSNLPSDMDAALERATQFIDVADRVQSNRPAFEWEAPSLAAA